MMVNENTRRNLEQEVAGFKAQAAAGERAMKVRALLLHQAGDKSLLQSIRLSWTTHYAAQGGASWRGSCNIGTGKNSGSSTPYMLPVVLTVVSNSQCLNGIETTHKHRCESLHR